jgi:hypothetical protein
MQAGRRLMPQSLPHPGMSTPPYNTETFTDLNSEPSPPNSTPSLPSPSCWSFSSEA